MYYKDRSFNLAFGEIDAVFKRVNKIAKSDF